MFYYDQGEYIHQTSKVKRADTKRTLCYRALPASLNDFWPQVTRIATIGTDKGGAKKSSRDVRIIDEFADTKLSQPCLWLDHYFTHFPKYPQCEICSRCCMQKKHCRKQQDRTTFSDWVEPTAFGDAITADYKVDAEKNVHNQSRENHRDAWVMLDWVSKWLMGFPTTCREASETDEKCVWLCGPSFIPKIVHADNGKELLSALKQLGAINLTCTPHLPPNNGIAENSVRKVT